MKNRNCLVALALVVFTLGVGGAHAQRQAKSDAQAYPVRPVRLIIPYSPGGASDNIARVVMPRVGEALRQTIVLDNRPGGGGILGRCSTRPMSSRRCSRPRPCAGAKS